MTTGYRSQLKKLKKVAILALQDYPLKVKGIRFIRFGENAVYKVDSDKGSFALRVHRPGYHSLQALQEELTWVQKLSRSKSLTQDNAFRVAKPFLTRSRKLSTRVVTNELATVYICDLLEWIPGRHLKKNFRTQHFYQLGKLIGTLQRQSTNTKHRRYWDSKGLVGAQPTLGSLKKVKFVTVTQQKQILSSSKKIYQRLRNYEKKFPDRMGLIHADLHFGNLILQNKKMIPIDFDDCGFGFHAYDIAVVMMSLEFGYKVKSRQLDQFKSELLRGYQELQSWGPEEEKILPWLIQARFLSGLAWMNSRTDNARLMKLLPKYTKDLLKNLRRNDICRRKK